MLISIPTGTSTIFGVFQAIIGLLAHCRRDSLALVNVEANTEFPNRAMDFQSPLAQGCDGSPRVQRNNAAPAS